MRMRNKPYWLDANTWTCPTHLPAARISATVEKCWYGCGNTRPECRPVVMKVPEPVVRDKSEAVPCAWDSCENAARKNSKYCSRNCSNKNARARYKLRKAA